MARVKHDGFADLVCNAASPALLARRRSMVTADLGDATRLAGSSSVSFIPTRSRGTDLGFPFLRNIGLLRMVEQYCSEEVNCSLPTCSSMSGSRPRQRRDGNYLQLWALIEKVGSRSMVVIG
jgi:hypothetical protein